MKNNYKAIVLGVVVTGVVVSYGVSHQEYIKGLIGKKSDDAQTEPTRSVAVGAQEPGNNKNLNRESTSNGPSERMFIEEMIPHHQEAIASAKQEIARGENVDTIKLARDIVEVQERELSTMKSLYKAWYGVDYKSDENYKPAVSTLTALSGSKLDRAFLEGMIDKHMSALTINQTVVPNIQHQEMADLVREIAEGQSNQVITMRIILRQM